MAVYAIGDLQGCATAFEQLLERINFDPQRDRVWLTGDLVNRGPRSLDCLRIVRSLGDSAITVLGNHDLHLLALAYTARARKKSRDTLDDVLNAPDREALLDWLSTRPMLHHDVQLNTIMVHAGLAPQWDLATAKSCASELETHLRDSRKRRELFARMYGDQPSMWSPDLSGIERLRFITNCLTRVRMCRSSGAIDLKHKGTLDDAGPDLTPWFAVPTRRSKDVAIVFGHWSALGFYRGDNVIGLDTGCVWGNQLCALRIDQPSEPVFVSCAGTGAQE